MRRHKECSVNLSSQERSRFWAIPNPNQFQFRAKISFQIPLCSNLRSEDLRSNLRSINCVNLSLTPVKLCKSLPRSDPSASRFCTNRIPLFWDSIKLYPSVLGFNRIRSKSYHLVQVKNLIPLFWDLIKLDHTVPKKSA